MFEDLFEGVDGLNESVVEKVKPLFEAAVEARVQDRLDEAVATATGPLNEQVEELREQLAESHAQNAEHVVMKLAESVEGFLDTVTSDWAKENIVAIQNGHIVESAQQFLASISDVANGFNAELNEGHDTRIEDLENQLDEERAKANDAITESVRVRTELNAIKRKSIVESVAEGMSELGRQRLDERCERLHFNSDKADEFETMVSGMRALVEKTMKEDDLFQKDGDPEKSKQDATGKMKNENDDMDDDDLDKGDELDEKYIKDGKDKDKNPKDADKMDESEITRSLRARGLIK